ncbi:Cyclic di-GMP phosphodiesterase response regulator RpfG [Rubripirellula tenax]|uniref:Cyclic di-GMP phosphodiesterase response regulator RpfG n=2 Tax=Rubripirellula tenax TaxID=2528015 RepID=A0A5C6EE82_9BACT|nr:Cyclic di-GMP phosphodiesterase response regulator RpfG [Rubripirellula tenax]
MQDQGTVRVSLDEISLGATCRFDISDELGILLLGNGRPLTATVRDQILERGVSFLEVHPDDAKSLRGEMPKGGAPPVVSKKSVVDKSVKSRVVDRASEAYSPKLAAMMRSKVSSAINFVSVVGSQIDWASICELKSLRKIPTTLMALAEEDSALAIVTSGEAQSPDPLADRCVRMSVLAIGTAIELGMTENEVVQAGTSGLVHDFGLYRFPAKFRDPSSVMNADEVWQYRRHPTVTVDLMANMTVISDETRLIAHQVHERADGTGYPRGIRGTIIHPIAKLLSVVDAFLSLTGPGPGRLSFSQHDAMVFLLRQCGRGVFDSTVMRAFLNQLTLYPISSRVELDDGSIATVVRRHDSSYATPVIQTVGADAPPFPISDTERTIVNTVVQEGKEIRMTNEMMNAMVQADSSSLF